MFSPPPIKPLQRLAVTDGLIMNAERWRQAHEYHRERQNFHYQSLNEPGIVCGLGVHSIPPPDDVPEVYRDGRWVQIQPGIAIDLVGNPIVVPEPVDFRIASEVPTREPVMVYLVLRYIDPEKLGRKDRGEIVTEAFRIDENTSLPANLEVEVCRICLGAGEINLRVPTDIFFPENNTLDLRYRRWARSRAVAVVRVAQLIHDTGEQARSFSNLSYLLQSLGALYPTLAGADEIAKVSLQAESEDKKILDCDLIYLTRQQSVLLRETEFETLRHYLETGGVVLMEVPTKGTNIEELTAVRQQLEDAIASVDLSQKVSDSSNQNAAEEMELAKVRHELQDELEATQKELQNKINELCMEFIQFAQTIGTPLEYLEHLNRNHPLRIQPFLFGVFPNLRGQEIYILNGGGIVVVIGDLSSAWGLDEGIYLSRSTIRTAQEMGINILHFAWRRRQLTQLMLSSSTPADSTPGKGKRAKRSKSDLFDKLI